MDAPTSVDAYGGFKVCFLSLEWLYMHAPNLCQAFLRVTRPTGFDCTRASGLLPRRKAAAIHGFQSATV
jgi:hypothetical protein